MDSREVFLVKCKLAEIRGARVQLRTYPKNNSESSLRRTQRARVLGAGFERESAAEDEDGG